MKDYILFIDTETSDRPHQWNSSTDDIHKWPYVLQVSWTVCKSSGETLFTRDFYINPGEIQINPNAYKIHGINLEFLQQNGISREDAIMKLVDDIKKYKPLLVGHFLKFDLRMIEVALNRVGETLDLDALPKFCTMLNTRRPYAPIDTPMLRLNQLYQQLFNRELKDAHNAKVDAVATKECFFEQVKQGKIDDKVIQRQQRYFRKSGKLRGLLLQFLS
ncbi:3'-5' exonuclease [Carboxylicivirga caseinilyticus]|uniref:3'-5' exonuclease n=1 Tax=Carboxylicivirga caseinilyticus TaxID=3417572 RepID=UPI003D32B355|nr:3'-5' exonuclease [Marinilabiliaceae bacterium A049]